MSRIRNRQEEVGPDFKTEIYKWALECICSVTLKRKVGFLELQGLSSASEPARMLESLIDATDAIRRCENGQFVGTCYDRDETLNCETFGPQLFSHLIFNVLRN